MMKNTEIKAIYMIIAFILFGIFFDFLNFLGYPLILVNEFEDYVQTVIQVQATCATLGLTIVTLLGNVMTKHILGVGVADFVMNRQRRLLTQKHSIIVCLLLVSASIFLYVLQTYNLIFGLFSATIVIVLYMVISICQIFQPDELMTEQIKQYILEHLNDGMLLDSFYGEAEKNREALKGVRLEQYKEFFLKIWEQVLDGISVENISKKNIEIFKSTTMGQSKSLMCFIKGKEGEQYLIAIDLLNAIYEKYNEKNIVRNKDTELNIFSDVYEDMIVQLRKDYQAESYKLLNSIPDAVFVASMYLIKDNDGKEQIRETSDIRIIADYYRWLINVLCKNGLDENDKYAMGVVCTRRIKGLPAVLSEETDDSDKLAERKRLFAKNILTRYILTLILRGDEELIQKIFFENYIGHLHYSINKDENDIVLTILAYMHYLAYSEDKKLLQESGIYEDEICRKLWMNNANGIEEFFGRTYAYCNINSDTIDRIVSILRSYEVWGNRNGKMLIMEESVRSFILITAALFNPGISDLEGLYNKIIRENEYFSYYEQFCTVDQRENLLQEIDCFTSGILDPNRKMSKDTYAAGRVELKYKALVDSISALYAKRASIEVKERNRSVDVKKETNDLQILIGEHINELFKKIDCIGVSGEDAVNDPVENTGGKTVNSPVILVSVVLPSQFAKADSIMNHIGSILDASIISLLKRCLEKYECLDVKSYKYDKHALGMYMTDMRNSLDFDVVIGTKNSWINAPVEEYKSFKEWLDAVPSVLVYGLGQEKYLINLDSKKVNISISNVSAVVRDFTTEEAEAEIRVIDGAYLVNVTNDIWLKYGKDEAIEFIKSSKKTVNISATIEIRTVGEKVGRISRLE